MRQQLSASDGVAGSIQIRAVQSADVAAAAVLLFGDITAVSGDISVDARHSALNSMDLPRCTTVGGDLSVSAYVSQPCQFNIRLVGHAGTPVDPLPPCLL